MQLAGREVAYTGVHVCCSKLQGQVLHESRCFIVWLRVYLAVRVIAVCTVCSARVACMSVRFWNLVRRTMPYYQDGPCQDGEANQRALAGQAQLRESGQWVREWCVARHWRGVACHGCAHVQPSPQHNQISPPQRSHTCQAHCLSLKRSFLGPPW